ncbi:MAG: symmetrical bis(5'-nucleosyl)-tetraphosphatase [Pseudomonadota bacterium]
MAVYAIGDIQGCYDPFMRLLDRIEFDPGCDTLWLTGDLVNRGPKSLKTLRAVRAMGDTAITVLGNHDLHLLALSQGTISNSKRFGSLEKTLRAAEIEEIIDWLRFRPLAHYDEQLDTLLVHAGIFPTWTVEKTLRRAAEVQRALRSDDFPIMLDNMYGNRPTQWSGKLKGHARLRFIINCMTRMRMLTPDRRLRMSFSGAPWKTRGKLRPWYEFRGEAWGKTRIVFGHWSQLGLIVLPELVSLDTGCVWGRQLTAVRIDATTPEVFQVPGQG